MKFTRRISGLLGVLFVLMVFGAGEAEAQRSTRVDFGGWSDYDGTDCADSGLLGAVSGNQVTLGSFTLAGYDPIWDAGTGDFSGCQVADAEFSDPYFATDSTLRTTIGLTDQTPGARFSFFTEENIFALTGGPGSENKPYMVQWELWYFNDAIIAALLGPVQYLGGTTYSTLGINNGDTYLKQGNTKILGGSDGSFGSNFLCFSADASTFRGSKSAADLGSCRDGGDDDGGGDDVSEVPLPGTLGLLGLGIAALGAVRRRQRT